MHMKMFSTVVMRKMNHGYNVASKAVDQEKQGKRTWIKRPRQRPWPSNPVARRRGHYQEDHSQEDWSWHAEELASEPQ